MGTKFQSGTIANRSRIDVVIVGGNNKSVVMGDMTFCFVHWLVA
ncbi:hypothetical protein [Candidatus Steffania adelgidicola]|nr:hypothetical protein [Candidatus Steffania adelgidicola]